MSAIIRIGLVEKNEFQDRTIYYAVFSASVDGEEIDCGWQPFDTWAKAGASIAEWINTPHDVDELALKLTRTAFEIDPYCGAEFGEVLKSTSDQLQTLEGCRFLLSENATFLQESLGR